MPAQPRPPKKVATFGLEEYYEPLSVLGRGGTGETWLMREIATGDEVAVKLIERPIIGQLTKLITREIDIQAQLGEGHRNIVNLHEVLLTPSHLALSMEYCAGGSLTGFITSRFTNNENSTGQPLGLYITEDEARFFFKQFIGAVEYCHKHNVMHRDLKLDNTLLDNSNPPYIKICDFGFAKTWGRPEDANTSTTIGTPVYMSPEVLSTGMSGKAYMGTAADVWSSGVLLFVMLMGAFPFDHFKNPDPDSAAAQREVLLQQITTSWRECVNQPELKRLVDMLSDDCKDLLDHIFVTDASKRFDMEAVKAHPWMCKPLPAHFEEALSLLLEEQEIIDVEVEKRMAPRFLKAMAHRSKKVKQILQEAKTMGVVPGVGGAVASLASQTISEGAEGEDTPIPVSETGVRRVDLRQGIDHFEKSKSFANLMSMVGE